jgi:hypothetical protein
VHICSPHAVWRTGSLALSLSWPSDGRVESETHARPPIVRNFFARSQSSSYTAHGVEVLLLVSVLEIYQDVVGLSHAATGGRGHWIGGRRVLRCRGRRVRVIGRRSCLGSGLPLGWIAESDHTVDGVFAAETCHARATFLSAESVINEPEAYIDQRGRMVRIVNISDAGATCHGCHLLPVHLTG